VEATRATDEELVAAILEGDAALYTDLVERYRGRLINYLNRFLGNAEESEELSQEVFLRVYRALDRYNPKYRFSTWLFRVARNAAIDLIRKRRLKLVPMQRVGRDGQAREREFESEERDPYRTLRNLERRHAIGAAIDGLREEYRELIQLIGRETLTQLRHASGALGPPEATGVHPQAGPDRCRRHRLARPRGGGTGPRADASGAGGGGGRQRDVNGRRPGILESVSPRTLESNIDSLSTQKPSLAISKSRWIPAHRSNAGASCSP